jgi:peptidoglycan hydrolase CwlO-like protein
MTKQLLAVVVVAVVLSTVIGFTIGSSTSPENANAATEQTEVVKQLKRLNVQMAALNMKTSALNSKTGDTQTAEGSVRGLLTIICDYTASIDCKK